MTTLSDVLRHLRESRGLTRQELARLSGVSRTHLWGIETGMVGPSLATLEKLSDALDVGLARLLSQPNDELLLEDQFVRAVRPFLRRLNHQERVHLLNTLAAAPHREQKR
jgi:transcriptional regulator with XRE-family HTH domain